MNNLNHFFHELSVYGSQVYRIVVKYKLKTAALFYEY